MELGLVSLPWLRAIDGAWLAEIADDAPIFTLDNHYLVGGQGDAVLAALAAEAPAAARVTKIGVTEIPKSGENNETLHTHGLDAEGIAMQVREALTVLARS
jgi:transketolase